MTETDTGSGSTKNEIKRFKTNPVEIVILMTVALVLCNSVYNLFYDTQGYHPSALKDMAANPISEGRSPASATASSFMSAEINCDNDLEKDTAANKIRLSGPLCGDAASVPGQITRTTVLNEANKFNATVFTDTHSAKFSTDYIPLTAGKNQIKVEFALRSGKIITQNVAITKF